MLLRAGVGDEFFTSVQPDLPEVLSHLVNLSSTQARPEVGIKISSCRLKGKISFGVWNVSVKVAGDVGGGESAMRISVSSYIRVGRWEPPRCTALRVVTTSY